MPDTAQPDAEIPDAAAYASPFASIDLNRTPLGGALPNIDPPDPANPNLDGGQVLYHMALGAQPEDFHPTLQPLAQGYSIAMQPKPDLGPGLLGSAEDIRAAIAPAPNDPLALDTEAPTFSFTPSSKAPALDNAHDKRAVFIRSAIPAAVASQKASGVPASVTLAQAALESATGARHMGDANNYFGLKAQVAKGGGIEVGPIASGHAMLPTKEFKNGQYVTENAPFRSYGSMMDSFSDHANFLSTQPRYAAALGAYSRDKDALAFARVFRPADMLRIQAMRTN